MIYNALEFLYQNGYLNYYKLKRIMNQENYRQCYEEYWKNDTTITKETNMKKLNDFIVTDMKALAAHNQNLVKFVPNIPTIRTALKLGFKLPGIKTTEAEKE